MSLPLVTIFTCSYNKPSFVPDAINSVLSQTMEDFEYIILENSTDKKTREIVHGFADKRLQIIDADFSSRERRRIYVESRLKNNYLPQARGKFIMTLADDDFLEPTCFAQHLSEFARDKKQIANFHACRIVYLNSKKAEEILPAIKTFGPHRAPHMRMDGGSIMFRRHLLAKLPQPYFKCNWYDAHISDGLFLNKIARSVTIHPINKILHTKRVTRISTHTYIDENGKMQFFRPKQFGWKHLNLDQKQ